MIQHRVTGGSRMRRAAIEAQIVPRRRVQVYRRIGELLECDEHAADAARLAYHWTAAGDSDRTLRYSEAAADRAAELHDYAAAMRFIEAALRTAPADLATVARLSEKLADAAMIEAAPSRARDQIDVALRAYAALGDPAGLTRMHLHRSRLRWFDGDPAAALAEAQRALDGPTPAGLAGERFHVRVRLAQQHQLAGRHADVRLELESAHELLAERDSAAFERLYDAYVLLVYGIARRILGDDGTAEDVTQAAFLKLWTNPQAFRGGNFDGWLARITRNCALDALRREAVRRTGTLAAGAGLEAWTDDVVLAERDGDRVRWALAQLPRENRELIEMGFFADISHRETPVERRMLGLLVQLGAVPAPAVSPAPIAARAADQERSNSPSIRSQSAALTPPAAAPASRTSIASERARA